jgi:hypothetical protein
MLVIYSPYKNPRLEYILDFLFHSVVHLSYTQTSSIEEYKNSTEPKIAYSPDFIPEGKWIWASSLLNESSINKIVPETSETDWGKIIFATSDTRACIPFDIFSASFWLVSRYEEYVLPEKDKHQRFDFHFSWAYQQQLIRKPIVNSWIEKLVNLLKTEFPSLLVEHPLYKHIPTIDIDNLFAFKGKSFSRSFLSFVKSALYFRGDLLKQRMLYLLHKSKDPYDTYPYIIQQYLSYKLTPVFFILTSKTDEYDRNLPYDHPLFICTVQQLNETSDIGIHLSYFSNERNSAAEEIMTLSNICNKSIQKNRFHYLRFQLPERYRQLVRLGICEDYSMGYVQIDGFRASTCTPFYFFDLEKNEPTSLLVYPLPFIDRTLFEHLKLNPQKATELIEEYITLIKQHNGVFVSLWHNETLQEAKPWNVWRAVFEKTVAVDKK